ncbi:MAG: hypothetical protein U1F76_10110 [Candidatus Competibacteraceae bacterium]
MDKVHGEPLQSYRVAGIGLHLSGDPGDSLAQFTCWFIASFCAIPDRTAPADIKLHIITQGLPASVHAATPPTHQSPAIQTRWQDNRGFLLMDEAACKLDLQARHGTLWLTPGFWRLPRKRQQKPVLFALIWLLRECRRYVLHASAVAHGGQGLVMAGISGSGKSTMALTLVQQGWQYLADDVVLLEPSSVQPRLWGLARGFTYHPTLLARLPELATPVSEQAESGGVKQFTDLDTVYPGRHLLCCNLRALVFPQVVAQDRSRLFPLEPVQSLFALIPASPRLMADKNHAAAQLEFLKTLVMQRPAYRLLAGRDGFGNGQILETLLTANQVLESCP